MRMREFSKSYDMAGANYKVNITCNRVGPNRYLVYGHLQTAKGAPVFGVPVIRRTAKTLEAAIALAPSILFAVRARVSEGSKPKEGKGTQSKTHNEIDTIVAALRDQNVVFHTPAAAGSKKLSWNPDTHRAVYTYWLSHNISDLVLRMAESSEPEEVLRRFRDSLINATYDHGRSKKNRAQVSRTVDNHLYQMNILLQHLCSEHPEIPKFDLISGSFLARVVPEEQVKALPEPMCQYIRRELEARIETEPRQVICAVLMYDGALRTAEAAGVKLSCIVFYDSYAVIMVLYQEKAGERIERLKTANAYRFVVISYWAMTIIRRCLDVLQIAPDSEALLLRAEELSRWVRSILRSYDAAFMDAAEAVERTNPDYDDEGKPIYDIGAYVLRRNAASRWLNYDGLTHDEIDILLGHKEKQQRPEVYLMDPAQQEAIARKLERYVHNPELSRNPACCPIQVDPGMRQDLDPYSLFRFRNTSGKPVRLHLDLVANCPGDQIYLNTPEGSAEAHTSRPEKLKPASRIVIQSNLDLSENGGGRT